MGTAKIPGTYKSLWALSILQQAPCISSQAVILTNFRLTSSLENLLYMDKTVSALETCVLTEKNAL